MRTVKPLGKLTHSRVRSFRDCPRKYFFSYVLRRQPVADTSALSFGKAAHAVLEKWWRDGVLDLTCIFHLDAYAGAKLEALLHGYVIAYADFKKSVQVLAVEENFDMPLTLSRTSRLWTWAGRIDLIVRLPDGKVAVVEHKTSSESPAPGSVYRQRLVLDGQVSTYLAGAECLGVKPDLCIYDVLVKPALRPLKVGARRQVDETPDEFRSRCAEAIAADPARYYAHIEVVRLEGEGVAHLEDTWQWGQVMAESHRRGHWPRNPDACFMRSQCAYWGVCSGTERIDDDALFHTTTEQPDLERRDDSSGSD